MNTFLTIVFCTVTLVVTVAMPIAGIAMLLIVVTITSMVKQSPSFKKLEESAAEAAQKRGATPRPAPLEQVEQPAPEMALRAEPRVSEASVQDFDPGEPVNGSVVSLFPEGTTEDEPALRPFQSVSPDIDWKLFDSPPAASQARLNNLDRLFEGKAGAVFPVVNTAGKPEKVNLACRVRTPRAALVLPLNL